MKTLREQLGKPVLFHMICSHGKDGNSQTGYDSRDPQVISNQLDCMQAFGGDGCGVVTLVQPPQGPSFPNLGTFVYEAVLAIHSQCLARKIPAMLCFDPWTVKGSSTPTDPNAAMIAAIQLPEFQYLIRSSSYLKLSYMPKLPVMDFSTGASKAAVEAAVPNINLLMNGIDYDWARIPPVPNKTAMPIKFVQFDDGTGPDRNKEVWDQSKPARIVLSHAGSTYWVLDCSGAADYVQVATWNDVKEQTAVEAWASVMTGIRIK